MSALEIVHLRSSGEPIDAVARNIRASIGVAGRLAGVVTLHRRLGLDADVAVHIRPAESGVSVGPRNLALCLAPALRAYGIVEHTLWEEI